MSTYSMAQVSSLTGINAHTLRIWERRYDFLKPKRTETNIRYYSDEELRRLLNIGILMREGNKISQINRLTDQEIHQEVDEILSKQSIEHKNEVDSLLLSTLEMNEHEFDKVFQRQVIKRGLMSTVVEIIYPFLSQIGILWGTSKVIPAQEHFISNLIRQKIIASIESLPAPPAHAPGILIFLLEGDRHELGLLLGCYLAKELGYRVYYLGQNVPLENIPNALEISKAKIMLTMFIVIRPTIVQDFVHTLTRNATVPLLVTGTPENFENEELLNRARYLARPTDLISSLKQQLLLQEQIDS